MPRSRHQEGLSHRWSGPINVKIQKAYYLNLDVLLQGMRLLVASEADSRVLKQLVPQGVAKSVILSIDGHGTLVTLPRILFVLDAPITIG